MSLNRQEIQRPSWVQIYLAMAFIFSKRSHDAQTQHGCIITDPEHRVLSCGCNGFPKKVDDDNLPNCRPEKYAWMIHSERNALANCVIRPPKNSIAYVTGQCCNDCIFALWQEDVTEVYMADLHGSYLIGTETKEVWDKFVDMSGIKIHYIKPDFNYIRSLITNFEAWGFIDDNKGRTTAICNTPLS